MLLNSSLVQPSSPQPTHLFRQVLAPDLLGDLGLEPDLGPLLLLGQVVALHGGAEAALVREAQLVQAAGAVLCGLVQPADDGLLVVQLWLLGAQHAEDDDLVLGQVAQRGEVAGAGVVVLEEVDVDVELLEQRLGDGLVPALREPLRAVVAPAQVDADGHVAGPLRDGGVDQLGVVLGQLLGLDAVPRGRLLAHALVAEVGEVGVVELDEAAPRGVEVRDLLLVHPDEVVEEGLQRRVRGLVDGLAPGAEVHHGRRGDADLGGDRVLDAQLLQLRVQELEVVDLDRLGVAKLSGDDQPRGSGQAVGCDIGRRDITLRLDAVEVDAEVDVEVGAAELAIRHGAEPIFYLALHDGRDVLVLDCAELLGGDLSG